jgi:hypothetical protein
MANQNQKSASRKEVYSSPDLFMLETVNEFGRHADYVVGIEDGQVILSGDLCDVKLYGSEHTMVVLAKNLIRYREDNGVGSEAWVSLVTPGRGFFDQEQTPVEKK